MNDIKLFWTKNTNWFRELRLTQKLVLSGGIFFSLLFTICTSVWLNSPTYGVLFSHLAEDDAHTILLQLEQANIPYQLENDGQDVLIDQRLVDKTRIKLMGGDNHLTHSVGFELFDKSDFGMTDFSQKINYQRALQGELERTISSLEEVKLARVQLSIPESHLFQTETSPPQAAVTLHLNQPLTPKQIRSIQQLVAASVAHLKPANVIIVDHQGNSLVANEEADIVGRFAEKEKLERYLSEKVMQLLKPVFANQNIVVKIDATLNYDELERERTQPQQRIVKHEKETQHITQIKSDKTPGNKDLTREKDYQLGHEKEHFIRANGTIDRLTISVVLPQHTSKTTLMQIERLVKSVVGFNPQRGDLISVEALTTTPINEPPPVQTIKNKPLTPYNYLIVSGVIILLMILTLLRFYLQSKQRKRLLVELERWLTENE